MRRALLGELEGACITRSKSDKVPHEYSTIVGIEESVHEILMNLKKIVFRRDLYGTLDASIYVRGPRHVTAQDIISPPSVEIVDTTQHIAVLTEPVDLCIELKIERGRGYCTRTPNNYQDGSYPIDVVSMAVRNANHSVHSYGNGNENGNEKQEILFLEIWTNGSLTPKEALYEASRNLIDLFIPFLHAEEQDINRNMEDNQLDNMKREIILKRIFIDQLELPPRTYNCLKRSKIHTLLDLLSKSQEDFIRIEHFRIEDIKKIFDILQKGFTIDLLQTSTQFESR
uniref:DNA-directed RNA polymerase n=2 Tax=Nymphaea colorata TaxID=210225 RepID=A0A5K1A2Q7_9MAGN